MRRRRRRRSESGGGHSKARDRRRVHRDRRRLRRRASRGPSSRSRRSRSSSSCSSSSSVASVELAAQAAPQLEAALLRMMAEQQQQQLGLMAMMGAAVAGPDARLSLLLGSWQGRDGTSYEVTWDDAPRRGPGRSLTVVTTRPFGRVQRTPGLVRLDDRLNPDDGRPLVLWGARGQYYLEDAALPDQAVWCSARCLGGATPNEAATFAWTRPAPRPVERCRRRSRSRG
mmetsp:Transcript_98757/g.318514  ORF Transcript_98757/g.318514 Transcript_98757/m.318514 type:complete len:228 (+) Transcript_98757:123-806(+)